MLIIVAHIVLISFFTVHCAPEKPSHESVKERREVVEEKIKEAEKKAKEAEKKVRIINEQIKNYQEKIKQSSSESAKETWRKGLKEAQKDKLESENIQQEEEKKVKNLEQEKKEIEALQKKLEDELVSVEGSAKENPLAEHLRSCIEKKIIELFSSHTLSSLLKKLLHEQAKALQQLVSYEHIIFANSNAITLEEWKKIREAALTTDHNNDPKYQGFIKQAFQLQEQIEAELKKTKQEFKKDIFETANECSLYFFIKEDKKLDELTNYDG